MGNINTSITSTLDTVTKGLSSLQGAIAVHSDNISGAAIDPDYVRRTVGISALATAGQLNGSELAQIVREVDAGLQRKMWTMSSATSQAEEIDNYNQRIQIFYGNPTDGTSISQQVDQFFLTIKRLDNDPNISSIRTNSVAQGQFLTQRIASIAGQLQDLQVEIDQTMSTVVDRINTLVGSLGEINQQLDLGYNSQTDTNSIMDSRDRVLNELSDLLPLSIHTHTSGAVSVNILNVGSLIDTTTSVLAYTPAASVTTFQENSGLNALTMSTTDSLTGLPIPNSQQTLISGGTFSEIVDYIPSGKLVALQQMRDVTIVQRLQELDQLAIQLRDGFNAVHNQGAGFPPATTLTGSQQVTVTDTRQFSGAVRIGLVDDSGMPIVKNDGTPLVPLYLDLGNLNSGSGAGICSYSSIVEEINNYFYYAPTQGRVNIGDFYDIKMASLSQSITTGGTLTFDFDLINNGQTNTTFQVLGVSVNNAAAGLTSPAMPGPTFIAQPGQQVRTGQPMTISFAGGIGQPYTVTVTVQVTNGDGTVTTGTIEYQVNDTTNPDILNDRYYAIGGGGGATFVAANNNLSFAQAQFVDINGNVVTSGNGYMQINALQKGYHLIINEANPSSPTQELGYTNGSGVVIDAPTNRNFSHYFGLNDFFITNDPITGINIAGTGSAQALSIRKDIVANPNLLSIGTMERSAKQLVSKVVGENTAQAELSFLSNPSNGDTLTLNGTTYTFVTAAPTTNSQIQIGATTSLTLTNAITVLGSQNTTTLGNASLANYEQINGNTLVIKYNTPGTAGNAFTVQATTLNPAGLSWNGGTAVLNLPNNSTLLGGSNTTIEQWVQPWTYEIAESSNAIANQLFLLSLNATQFNAAGTIVAKSMTFSAYASSVTAAQSTYTFNMHQEFLYTVTQYKTVVERFRSISGVNNDKEIANIQRIAATFSAAIVARDVIMEVYKKLIDVVRR